MKRDLLTVMNNHSGQRIFMEHVVTIPPCCPISQNPRPGSTFVIRYRAREATLEVASLYAYVHQFVGGKREPDETLTVRDMEAMILDVAQACAESLDVPVKIAAHLIILPGPQQFTAVARGYPKRE